MSSWGFGAALVVDAVAVAAGGCCGFAAAVAAVKKGLAGGEIAIVVAVAVAADAAAAADCEGTACFGVLESFALSSPGKPDRSCR